MTATRRQWLARAGAAVLCGPARASAVGEALDRALRLPAAEALVVLRDVRGADAGEELDLGAARGGLAVDAALARRFPDAPGRSGLSAWVGARAGTRGLAGDPDGAVLFALLLERQLGAVSPAVAERRLQAEFGRLQARAARLFVAAGRSVEGGVGAAYSRLWQDERYLYPDSDAGRARAVAEMSATLAAIRPQVTALVGPVPLRCLDVEVRALSAVDVAAGRGGYRVLPEGARRGAYVVDLKAIRRRPAWTLPSVVAHETLPGHLVQLPIEAERPPHALREVYTAAFAEGWSTYAETLVPYSGPLAELGHVHWLLFRVGRGLADLGIHLRGWSMDEARARLVGWQGEPAYFAPFDIDLPRIAHEPATRTAEAMAWLAIADGAQGRRGARLRAYHAAVLANGRKRAEQVAAVARG